MATTSLPTSQELRRSGAAALLTGVLLFSVVVLSRRSAGALIGFESATPAVLIAGAMMLIGTISGTLLRRRADLEFDLVLLATAFLAAPGLLVGLCLLPNDSSGLGVLLGEYALLVTLSLVERGWTCQPTVGIGDIGNKKHHETPAVGVPATVNLCSDQDLTSELPPTRSQDPLENELSESSVSGPSPIENELKPSALAWTPSPCQMSSMAQCTDWNSTPQTETSQEDDDLPSNLMQWMRRSLQEDVEVIEGAIRVTFASGSKQVAVHLPFSPPMTGLPEFEAEPLDDADLNVQVTSTHSYGVRFEVTRRHGLEERLVAEIGYLASAVTQSERAAA